MVSGCSGARCVVYCLVPPCAIVTKSSARAPSTRTTSFTGAEPPQLPLPSSPLHRMLLYGLIIARIIATHAGPWARLLLFEAGSELLRRAHLFAVNWAARCVSLLSTFLSANVSSATSQLGLVTDDLRPALVRGDVPHLQDLLERTTSLVWEVLVLHIVVYLLEKAVSLFFFLLGASMTHCVV